MSTLQGTHRFLSGQKLEISQGDLTAENVDAIVNAANAQLSHGGGIARIIVQKGGKIIQTESTAWVRENGPVPHHEPGYTGAGILPCRYVIHAVGPVWGEGDEDAKLEAAVKGSLSLADRLGLTSIGMPAISTGIFRFPKERAAGIFYKAINDYFSLNPGSKLGLVRIVLYDTPTLDAFMTEFLTWKKDNNPK
ncbi:MAG: macro domain-containing protein [Anaerolineaceae bacterium]|nr:macro domain-containing protein [Anaerolineaceae bacterium]